MFLIKTLYKFVRDSFVAPSIGVIKNIQHLSKELSLSKKFLSTHISTNVLARSVTSYHKKSLQKSLYTQQKKLSSLTRDCNLPILLISRNMDYPRKDLLYLKQVYTFQSNKIKIENPKSSLPSKRFIVHFLTNLNPRKPKIR